jgi:DNA-binding LacI/PurR family transcriptional regulator
MRQELNVATIEDVARVAGVSRSTVFRLLNGNKVRRDAREAIQAAMKELNYFHNPRHTRSDIVLIVSVREHFEGLNVYADMVAGVMNRADNLGLHVRLHAGPWQNDLEVVGSPSKARYGVLMIGKKDSDEEAESADLQRQGIPHVFVNRVFSEQNKSWVSVDLRRAALDAVEHLMSLGHVNIGTWGHVEEYRIDREKMAGFREAFEAHELPIPSACFSFERDGDLEDIARSLFTSGSFPPAWFGMADEHVMRLVKVIREFGLRIPEDIALVGMDDIEPSKFFTPPLSSIHIPFRQAGAAAVDVLLRLIEDPIESSIRIVLKHKLVIRESCGAHRYKTEEKPQLAVGAERRE